MNQLIPRVTHLLDEQKEFVIARIIDSEGASPRSTGWMLIEPSGESAGSIGGGALEGLVLKITEEIFVTKKSVQKIFQLNSSDEDGLDMRCGGNVEIRMDYVNGADFDEAEACRDRLNDIEEKIEVFIIGAGHVGLATSNQLNLLGIPVIIMDDREEFCNKDRFPKAKEVRVLPDFDHIFSDYTIGENSYIVIVTRGHKWDLEVLFQSLKTNSGYIGMIGSKAKVKANFDILRERGVTEDAIGRVDAPIGLPIPCETPEEIAVSIAGKILSVKYERMD